MRSCRPEWRGAWREIPDNPELNSRPHQTAIPVTFDRIQLAKSSSIRATAFAEIRWGRGNAPCRSSRQIVEGDSPVPSRTSGNRSSLAPSRA
jgi:hypothetical protein